MNRISYYEKLQSYFEIEKNDAILFSVLKSIVLLFAGGLSSNLIKDANSAEGVNIIYLLFLFILVGVFVILERNRLRKEKNLPLNILEQLKSIDEVVLIKESNKRKNIITTFIENSISSLNANTCPISIEDSEIHICDQELKIGLNAVIADIVNQPNLILNCNDFNFTVGIYLDTVYNINHREKTLDFDTAFYIFRDDNDLSGLFPENLTNFSNNTPEKTAIQTTLIESIYNHSQTATFKQLGNQQFTIISCPIPNVCEACPPDGSIFIIVNGKIDCPDDLRNVMLIFGNIVSNWVSRYNNCVSSDFKTNFEEKKLAKPPIEALKLNN